MKKFEEAFVEQKENKGISVDVAKERVVRILGTVVSEAEEEVDRAKLNLKIAQRNAQVDDLELEEAQAEVKSAVRRAIISRDEKIESLKERFDSVWGKPDLASIKAAFAAKKAIAQVEAFDVEKDPTVIAAKKALAALTNTPDVNLATKAVEEKEAALASLKEFTEAAVA